MSLDHYETKELFAVLLSALQAESGFAPRVLSAKSNSQKEILISFGAETMVVQQPDGRLVIDESLWMTQARRDHMMSALNAEIEARELQDLIASISPRKPAESRL